MSDIAGKNRAFFGLRECKHFAVWSSGQNKGVQFKEWDMLVCCVTLNILICLLVFQLSHL